MADMRLLLHFEGENEATSTVDSSGRNHNSWTFENDAIISTADSKWGNSSLYLPLTGQNYIHTADHADWDFFSNNTDSKTIDFWIKDVWGSSGMIFSQYEDSENQTYFSYVNNGSAYYGLKVSNNLVINLGNTGFTFPQNTWVHIAVIKVANEYGIYEDGVQRVYLQDDDIGSISASLQIGALNGASAFNGYIDEFHIAFDNLTFSASPQADLSDTIDVPVGAYEDGEASSESNFNQAIMI